MLLLTHVLFAIKLLTFASMQSPLHTHKDVLMTETWLTSTDVVKLAELKPGGYELKGNPRPSGMIGGGIDIIFKTGTCCHLATIT